MKNLKKHVFYLLLLLVPALKSQVTVNPSPSYTVCPNQVMTITATWNNVSNITYTVFFPGGSASGSPIVGNTFTLVNNPQVPSTYVYTITGNGTGNNGPTSSTAIFTVEVIPPSPMALTNVVNYCYGTNATITAPIGGTQYTVLGGCFNNFVSNSNIITLPNVQTNCNAQYTVVTDMGGCIMQGVTSLNVSPNYQIIANPPVSVCEGDAVTLSAALTSGTNWEIFDNMNASMGKLSTVTFTPTLSQSGTYTFTAQQSFAGIFCPRSATTSVTVIQINQVFPSATPGTTLCQGANLNLGSTASGATSFQWQGPQSFFSNAQNPVISNVTTNQIGTYTVTAFFQGAFKLCSTNAVISISVIPVSVPVVTLTSDVCQNGNVNLSATAPGAASFMWNGPYFNGVGAPGANVPLVNVQPNASGTYYVTAKFGSNQQCAVTSSAALNVVPVSEVQVVTPVSVCAPDNAPLQSNAPGANSFSWKGPNNFTTPGANVLVYQTSPKASGIYTVTANFGGGNITCPSTNTVEVFVNPTLQFSLVPRQQMCYGEAVSILGPNGATSYTWTSSTGYKSNVKDITFSAIQPKDAGSYTLEINLGPCKTVGETVIDVVSPISFTLRPDDKVICLGDTIVLEAMATGGSQNYAYTWNPGIYLDSPYGSKKTVSPGGSVIYNLVVHDIACPNFSLSHSFSVVVNEPPTPSVAIPQGEACQPYCMFLNPRTQDNAAITTFDFGSNIQFQMFPDQDSIEYCLKDPGVYHLKVHTKDTNGCTGVYEYPYPITVHQKPGTKIIAEPEFPTTVDEVVFTPVHAYEPIDSYRWMFSGGIDPRDTSKLKIKTPGSDTTNKETPSRIFDKVGTYPVMLISTTDKGCTDTVAKFIKVIDDMQIFIPNAFTPNGDGINDNFYIKGTGMDLNNFSLEVTDRWGVVVFFTRDIHTAWDGTSKGTVVRDGAYSYLVKVVGMNGEGRREITGHVVVIK